MKRKISIVMMRTLSSMRKIRTSRSFKEERVALTVPKRIT